MSEQRKVTGLHTSRLRPEAQNPREVAFAEQWVKEDEQYLLTHLFRVPCTKDDPECVNPKDHLWNFGFYYKAPLGEPTERDRIVAATLIQWLGSNCGMALVYSALEKAGYRIVKDRPSSPSPDTRREGERT